jgi:hypothetical protein
MKKSIKHITKKKGKLLFWLPRIITIVFILFISIFALDIFDMNLGFWGIIFGLFMHLLPTIILTLILIIFWKKSIVLAGMWLAFGILYLAIMLPNMLKQFEFYYLSWLIQFSGIAFVISWLFFLDFKRRK